MHRPLAPDDLPACLELDRRCLEGLWTAEQWQTELADPQRPGLGIWRANQLVAMACGWLVIDELHITLLAVEPSQRRQGLGRAVLLGLLHLAGQRGAQHATLEVAAANGAALALYGQAGFHEAGRRRGYYRNGEDAVIQWKRLSPRDDGSQE